MITFTHVALQDIKRVIQAWQDANISDDEALGQIDRIVFNILIKRALESKELP